MLDVAAIKECCDILVVAEQVGIQTRNEKSTRPQIICPAHNDTHFGSAFLNVERNTFHCYSCGAKGDVFSLVQAALDVSFKEAAEIVADICGGSEHFQIDECEQQKQKYTHLMIPKNEQTLIGIQNEPIFADIAFSTNYSDIEEYIDNPDYSVQYGKDNSDNQFYIVQQKLVNNPLYELLQSDEEVYHDVIETFCSKTLMNYKILIKCLRNPQWVSPSLKEPIDILNTHIEYMCIIACIAKLAKRVEKISITYGTGNSLQLVKDIESEYSICVANRNWQADAAAPF